jgi:hypothetical protein
MLARRIDELTTVPMRSENHPTWDPKWKLAINRGLSATVMKLERALVEIERLAQTL